MAAARSLRRRVICQHRRRRGPRRGQHDPRNLGSPCTEPHSPGPAVRPASKSQSRSRPIRRTASLRAIAFDNSHSLREKRRVEADDLSDGWKYVRSK